MSKLNSLFIASLMISTLFAGCTEDEESIDISGITFSGNTLVVTEGITYDLAEAIEATGADADKANFTFVSGDASVVSVDGTSLTAQKIGSSTLTATETNTELTATVNVEVNAKVVDATGIALDKETADLKVGETLQLTATIAPADATEQGVTWSVAFPSGSKAKENEPTDIATVSDAGLVTAKVAGDVVVTATSKDGSFTDHVDISITNVDVAGVQILIDGSVATSATVEGNEVLILTPSIEPANATNKSVTWSLEYTPVAARSNREIGADYYASIDAETGTITGKAECNDCGLKLVVTTTDGEKVVKIPLNIIYVEVVRIQFEQNSYFTINAGETEQMGFTVIPKNANDQNPNVNWEIDRQDNGYCSEKRELALAPDYSDFATVDENGLITAIKNYDNDCYDLAIVATIEGIEESTSAMFDVVNVDATSVTIDQGNDPIQLESGTTTTLTASVLPENTTVKTIKWYTYDPTQASRVLVAGYSVSVDANTGVVTTNYLGTTTVYAYNDDSELIDSIDIQVVCTNCD